MGRWFTDAVTCLWGAVGQSGGKRGTEGSSPVPSCHLPTGRIFNFRFLTCKVMGTLTLHWADERIRCDGACGTSAQCLAHSKCRLLNWHHV